MKRLLSITDYAFLWASVFSWVFVLNTDECTGTVFGSSLTIIFAVLAAVRGEIYDKKGVSSYTVFNRVISGGGTAIVIIMLSGSLSYCLFELTGFNAELIWYSLLAVGIVGSLVGPIRGVHH